jgi:hypothetical protein
MNKQILYASLIFTLSALLLTTITLPAEAKDFQKENEISLKGKGLVSSAKGGDFKEFKVKILPIANEKIVLVDYRIVHGTQFAGGICIADKQILKVSGTNKASASFNTAELDCSVSDKNPGGIKLGQDTTISIKFEATGVVTINEKFDDTQFEPSTGLYTRTQGSTTDYEGSGDMTAFDEDVFESNASIQNVKFKRTTWYE